MVNESRLIKVARGMRLRILQAVARANASHVGGCFSMVEIMVYLYHQQMDIDSIKQKNIDRDYCVLSKGHSVVGWYAALETVGLLPSEIFDTYGSNGTELAGHPVRNLKYNIEASTGSLGHGLPIALGLALGLKKNQSSHSVYVVVGDGEVQEGAIWEACMMAASNQVHNLWIIVDCNKGQGLHERPEELGSNNLEAKFTAFGCVTARINGHSFSELESAFSALAQVNQPKVIIADTIKGKGVSFMEDKVAWHYKSPNPEQLAQACEEVANS